MGIICVHHVGAIKVIKGIAAQLGPDGDVKVTSLSNLKVQSWVSLFVVAFLVEEKGTECEDEARMKTQVGATPGIT